MFSGAVKLTLAARGLAGRTGEFEGVALWLPGRVGLWPVVRSGFASARFAVTPPFPNIRRLMAMLRQFAGLHRQRMPGKHWYLPALGVDPKHQRGGHGSALVRRGIQRAAAVGLPMYLATEDGSERHLLSEPRIRGARRGADRGLRARLLADDSSSRGREPVANRPASLRHLRRL